MPPLSSSAASTSPLGADQRTRPHQEDSTRRLVTVAGFSCLVVALQQTLVVPVIPQLPQLLQESPSTTSWVVTATLLSGAVSTPIVSRLADSVGKKRMLVAAMMCVLVGSVIAPLGGIVTVVLRRTLQGIGTALVPVAMAVMRDELPPHQLGGSLAFLSATLGIGGGVGIPLGGLISGLLNWQALFWFSALLSLLSLVAIQLCIPAHAVRDSGRFDWGGAVLLSTALTLLLLGISKGGAWGWSSAATLTCLAGGLLLSTLFCLIELRMTNGLVDVRTATTRPVLLTHLASLAMGFAMFTNLLYTTTQLQGSASQGGFDQSAAVAGAAMLPSALVMFAIPSITASLERRFGAPWVLSLGAVITLLAYGLRPFTSPSAVAVIAWTTIAAAGIALCYAALPLLLVLHVPRHETAAANGINALVRAIGTAIASAFVAGVGTSLAVRSAGAPEPSAMALLVMCAGGAAAAAATWVFGILLHERKQAS